MENAREKQIGNYRIAGEIGSGATATVYLAEHVSITRKAAIKVLHPHLLTDEKSLERFRREAQAISTLIHENIVRIYDFAVERGRSYIVFEYIDGTTLKEFIKGARDFPVELSSAIMCEVCRALKAAHDVNIIHRDIKPENILLTRTGEVKLTDFGIARFPEMDAMTITGSLMGSPDYMSPEQIECARVDRTSDIFSMGVLFYFLMTGELPFHGPTHAKIIRNIMAGAYAPPETTGRRVNLLCSRIVEKCLQKNPGDRYQSAEELLEALAEANKCFGFDNPKQEIRSYFTSRESYLSGYEERLKKGLLAYARTALMRRNKAKALLAINHLFLLDEFDREGRSLYKRIRRKRALGVYAGAGAAAAGLVCVIGVFYAFMRASEKLPQEILNAPAPDSLVRITVAPPQKAPAVKPDTRETIIRHAVKRQKAPAGIPAPVMQKADTSALPDQKSVSRFGTFRIFTKPWAKLYIDDEYKGNTPFLGEVVVAAGTHSIKLVNPFCKTLGDSIRIAGDSVTEKRYELQQK